VSVSRTVSELFSVN